MVDLGPVSPSPFGAPLNRVAAVRAFSYTQRPAIIGRRRRRYILVITETAAGVRRTKTRRYNVFKGHMPELAGGVAIPATLPPLPMSIFRSAFVVYLCLVVISIALFGPFAFLLGGLLTLGLCHTLDAVERQRFAVAKAREDYELPPLLTEDELNTRLLQLAEPDENRTHDEPPPVPMPPLLRDRAWQRWYDRYDEASVRSVGHAYLKNPGSFRGHSWATDALEVQAEVHRESVDRLDRLRDLVESLAPGLKTSSPAAPVWQRIAALVSHLDDVALHFGCVARGIEDPAILDGPPQLDRPFKTTVDCGYGHVGEHPITSTFVDDQGQRRVMRACRWCVSTWSDLF